MLCLQKHKLERKLRQIEVLPSAYIGPSCISTLSVYTIFVVGGRMSPTLKTEASKLVVVGGRMSPTLKTEASKLEESKALMAYVMRAF